MVRRISVFSLSLCLCVCVKDNAWFFAIQRHVVDYYFNILIMNFVSFQDERQRNLLIKNTDNFSLKSLKWWLSKNKLAKIIFPKPLNYLWHQINREGMNHSTLHFLSASKILIWLMLELFIVIILIAIYHLETHSIVMRWQNFKVVLICIIKY